MTTKVFIGVDTPLAKRVVIETWQVNHVMGEHKRVESTPIDRLDMLSFTVWPGQYLIIKELDQGG